MTNLLTINCVSRPDHVFVMFWKYLNRVIYWIIPLPVPNWASAEAQFIPNCSLAAPQIFQIFSNFPLHTSVWLGLRSGAAKVRQSRCVRPPESSSSSSTQYRVEIVLWNWFCFVLLSHFLFDLQMQCFPFRPRTWQDLSGCPSLYFRSNFADRWPLFLSHYFSCQEL